MDCHIDQVLLLVFVAIVELMHCMIEIGVL